MRVDKKGIIHSLDQDIQEIWEAHGWIVISETLPRSRGKTRTWIIKAKPKKVA